ncbi:hypothetical protein EV356DRAFT_341517 [Viridothelium virens]|uniref:PHD-type domain-containing protein n=1 Tax=Viridothelium virens TaxID=1048519 RepID=A0A6A6GXI6_VIRVR|nr:hypothetical protein EV356DRAFT_341517 [Viridothelium virens]
MNSEQHTHGYTDWRIPSPSQTPTSTTFSSGVFVTPKTNSFPSHFQEAFSTPQPNGHQTPLQTPNSFGSHFTSTARPAYSYSQDKPRFDDPSFHRNHAIIDSSLQLPPVEESRRLSSSPNTSQPPKSTESSQFPSEAFEDLAIHKMNPTQMQTPPPTRDSSRRKAQQAYAAALNTPTIASRRTVTASPAQANYANPVQTQASPFALTNLQFSPDMYQFSNTGPATAPVYGQQRAAWAQTDGLSTMNIDWSSTFGHPFAAASQQSAQQMAWQDLSSHPNVGTAVQHTVTTAQNSPVWTQGHASQPPYTQINKTVHESPVTTGVDPSLLMSFSDPIADNVSTASKAASNAVSSSFPIQGRQPYEQQSQELKRDLDAEQARKSRQNPRNSTSSALATLKGTVRPGLGRANTVGGFKSSGRGAFSAGEQIARTSSPLKRQSQGSLASIPERRKSQRRSVVLTVDENGRASTETKIISDTNFSEPRQKYPSLWDDDSSESDSDDDVAVKSSRHSSLTFAPAHDRPFKAPRPTSKDVSTIPRSSSASSNYALWPSQATSQASSSRMSWGSGHSTRHSGSISSSIHGDALNENESRPESLSGDAHAALREAMEGRARKQESNNPQRMLDVQNKRWARLSADMNLGVNLFQQPNNISPTTIPDSDLTPSTDRQSTMSSDMTRCICGTAADAGDQLMVQCESCSYWLHVRCIGINESQLPPVYVCVFCTGQTPVVRGGRIREPVRTANPFASPLAQKTGRRL